MEDHYIALARTFGDALDLARWTPNEAEQRSGIHLAMNLVMDALAKRDPTFNREVFINIVVSEAANKKLERPIVERSSQWRN